MKTPVKELLETIKVFDSIEELKYWIEMRGEKLYEKKEKKVMVEFALFHSRRMRAAQQTDNEFYAKQSLDIFPNNQEDL